MTPERQMRNAVDRLRAAGIEVTLRPRWDDSWISGRGTFNPRYVMLHHTAGRSSLGVLTNTQWPPVRAAHVLVNRDGSVDVLGCHVTYHAGSGAGFGVPANTMNLYAWGIEIEDLGQARTMTDAQIDSTAILTAGLLDGMGQPIDHVIQHKAWSSTGKPDTRYTDEFWRAKVRKAGTTEEDVVKAFRDYTGKPADPITIPGDGEWHNIGGLKLEGAPFAAGHEVKELYLRCHPTYSGAGGIVTVRYLRDNDDPTAYLEEELTADNKSLPISRVHMEVGERDLGGRWQMRVQGGIESVKITTRYAKLHALDVDWL